MKRALILLTALAAWLVPGVASAHPLGNFTVNHYSRIEPSGDRVRVVYVLDMAEIPTFQDKPAIDAGAEAYAERRTAEIARNLHLTLNGQAVPLALEQKSLSFPAGAGGLSTLRLEAVYSAELHATGDASVRLDYRDDNDTDRIGWREIVARPGSDGTALSASSVPSKDVTDELRQYPEDLLNSPLSVREAHLTFASGVPSPASPSSLSAQVADAAAASPSGVPAQAATDAVAASPSGVPAQLAADATATSPSSVPVQGAAGAVATSPSALALSRAADATDAAPSRVPGPAAAAANSTSGLSAQGAAATLPPGLAVPGAVAALLPSTGVGVLDRTRSAFAELANGTELTPAFVLFAVGVALVLGCVHALQPGHGKTVVAAYLVGSRGTPRHAMFLGATVTATHTAGVYALGLVTLGLSQYVVPERLYPILEVVSGLLVLGIGIWLFGIRALSALGAWRRARDHAHAADHQQADRLGHAHGHHEAAQHPDDHAHAAHEHGLAHAHAAQDQHPDDHALMQAAHTQVDHAHGLGAEHQHDYADGAQPQSHPGQALGAQHQHDHAAQHQHDQALAAQHHDDHAHAPHEHDHAHAHAAQHQHDQALAAQHQNDHAHAPHEHDHDHDHAAAGTDDHDLAHAAQHQDHGAHDHALAHAAQQHDHGHANGGQGAGRGLDGVAGHRHGLFGKPHTHAPTAESGNGVSWKSLLALGVSGGLLPCPEALMVLLITIAAHRVLFGLLLILAFSTGLAGVLVGFGLLLVYARGLFQRVNLSHGPLPRLLPVASAMVIVAAGMVITAQALPQVI